MTVEQTVEIPADRRLTIDVPREIPAGTKARFEIIWHTPEEDAPQSATPLSDSLLGIAAHLGDISLEEIREERLGRFTGYTEATETERFDRISLNPAVMGGKPCIKGTRVTAGRIVSQIGTGETIEELLEDYPYIERQDIMQAIQYAAWIVQGYEAVPVPAHA